MKVYNKMSCPFQAFILVINQTLLGNKDVVYQILKQKIC